MTDYSPSENYTLYPYVEGYQLTRYNNISEVKSMSTYFNERVANLLESNYTTWQDTSPQDDSAKSATINSRGWNIQLDYSGEGNFGFNIIPAVAKKNKNYFVGSRSYYANGEPDYLFIFKRDQDGYFNNMTIRYNEEFMVIYISFRAYNSGYSYEVCYAIKKINYFSYDLLYFTYKNAQAWTSGANIIHSYKSYYDDNANFQQNYAAPFSDTNVKGFKTVKEFIIIENDIVSVEEIQPLEYIPQRYSHPNYKLLSENFDDNFSIMPTNKNKIPKQEKIYTNNGFIPKYYTDYVGKYSITNLLDKHDYNLKYFVEGVSDEIEVYIKNIKTKQIVKIKINNDIDNYLERITYGKYEITYSEFEHYKFLINPHDIISRGEIYGSINIATCGVPFDKLKILCFRSDGIKIGNGYNVNAGGGYIIPNLNAHDKYDIILIDTTKKIEWKVSSNRSPIPYDEVNYDVYGIENELLTIFSDVAILSWDYITTNAKLDDVNILYSDVPFEYDNYDSNLISSIRVNGTTFKLPEYIKHKYYMIETIYRSKRKYSSLIKYNNELDILSFGAEYIE